MNSEALTNIDFLSRRYPKLAQRLRAVSDSQLPKNFTMKADPVRMYDGDTLVDSTEPGFFKPFIRGENAARLVILNGFGLGALLQDTLLKALPETEEYIIIEPSLERFFFALCQTKFNEFFLDKKFHWLVGLEGSDLDREFYILLSERARLVKASAYLFRDHPVFSRIESNYFSQAKIRWQSALEISKKGHGFLSDSLEGLRNTVQNLEWIRKTPGIDLLKNQFAETPAIIVSTGPSLQKSLPQLRELQSKALLLAADASLKILLENEIQPHFVFVLERDEVSRAFFTDISQEKSKAHLVAFPFVSRVVRDPYLGPQLATYRQYGYYRFFEDQAPKGILRCGPSVAHMALSFADYIGCQLAILVGQDLAYDPETLASHPAGIAYEEWSISQSEESLRKKLEAMGQQFLWAPGNRHARVPTSSYYEVFRLNFAEMTSRLSIRIVNATDGGAKIPSIQWKPLTEVSDNFISQPELFDKIEKLRRPFKMPPPLQLKLIEQTIELALRKVSEIQEKISKAKDYLSILETRKAQQELQNDPVFGALTGNFSGEQLIEIDWSWNRLLDSPTTYEARYLILKTWVDEMNRVLSAVRSTLSAK